MKKKIIILWMLIVFYPVFLHSQAKEIIGYYFCRKWKERNGLVVPRTIPYDKLTIINYAFFKPLPTGEITGIDTVADSFLLKGEIDSLSGKRIPGTSLIDFAHRNNVQVMLSIGGWEDSNNFSQIASDSGKRSTFAKSCVNSIKTYGFDGIDIDWEFPCYPSHNGKPQDKHNFTLLLQNLRDSLNTLKKKTGKYYLLSAALPSAPSHIVNIEIKKVANILDFLNVMTYDYHGAWESISGYNAPLYPSSPKDDPLLTVDGSFKLYHQTYNIPASKINIGIPFYGRAYRGCEGPGTPHKGPAVSVFPGEGGGAYYEILNVMKLFKRCWDDKAKVPYLIDKSRKIFISYDDEESIAYKADYVLKNHIRGVIIWQITGDYLKNGKTPLLDVIYKKFNSSK